MPDDIPQTGAAPPVAPATSPDPAPAPLAGVSVSAPAVDVPAVSEPVAPAPVEAPAADPVVAPEPVATEPAKPAPSLLSTATTLEPTPPPPVEPEAPVEEPPLPTYEPFTFPEGVKADDAAVGRYTEVLGKHGINQEAGQALVDLHVAEIQRVAEAATQHQFEVFAKTQDDWVAETKAELGTRFDTTMREAAYGRDAVLLNPAYGGSQELLDSFTNLINFTGVGNHLTFIKGFAAIGRALAEPKVPNIDPQPVADRGLGRSRANTRYPNMPGNGAG